MNLYPTNETQRLPRKSPLQVKFVGKKNLGNNGRWSAVVECEGHQFNVSVVMGERVRIPYKPRGTYGHKWYAYVQGPDKHTRWSGRVSSSIGAKHLVLLALYSSIYSVQP
jgi:hypothetical protein